MAKIKTLGDAVVVVSTLKFEDIKFLEKYRKDALALKGGEDNKEIIFRVGASGTPSANEYGITFEGATRDEAKQAILRSLRRLFQQSLQRLRLSAKQSYLQSRLHSLGLEDSPGGN